MTGNERRSIEIQLMDAEESILKLTRQGISLGVVDQLLQDARDAKAIGDTNAAQEAITSILDVTTTLLEAQANARKTIVSASKAIAKSEDAGLDTTEAFDLVRLAKIAEKEGRYAEAAQQAEKANNSLKNATLEGDVPQVTSQKNQEDTVKALNSVTEIKKELTSLRAQLGRNESQLLTTALEDIKKCLSQGHYAEAERIAQSQTLFSYLTQFPFPHGLKMEVMITDSNGNWLPEERNEELYYAIIHEGQARLRTIFSSDGSRGTPNFIKKKIRELKIETCQVTQKENISLKYLLNNQHKPVSLIRHNRNSGSPRIVDIATPPCLQVEELEWWAHTVFSVVYDVARRDGDVLLLMTGANPVEKLYPNHTCGDHHHICIPDLRLRMAAYNLIRAYIPHLIALSVNSPFAGSQVPEISMKTLGRVLVQPPSTNPLSRRLDESRLLLGPAEGKNYLPYLTPELGFAAFSRIVKRNITTISSTVDMIPFNENGTIEVRFLDAQLSIRERIGFAVLLQAIASAGVKMLETEALVPAVDVETLSVNRDGALHRGGLFPMARAMQSGGCTDWWVNYQGSSDNTTLTIFKGCQNLINDLKEPLLQLRCHHRNWLDGLLVGLWGGTKGEIAPPISPSQYQAWRLISNDKNYLKLVNELTKFSDHIRQEQGYIPIVEVLGPPKFDKENWTPVEAEKENAPKEDPLSTLIQRTEMIVLEGNPVPIPTQIAIDIAMEFDRTGNQEMASSYALWGLRQLSRSFEKTRSNGDAG